ATQHASSVAGNQFNTTVAGVPQGNYWDDIFTKNLKIYDSNGDGFGDSGSQYPYSMANGGSVSAGVVDFGPIGVGQAPTPSPSPSTSGGGGGNRYYYYHPKEKQEELPVVERPGFVAPKNVAREHVSHESSEELQEASAEIEREVVETKQESVEQSEVSQVAPKVKSSKVSFVFLFVLLVSLVVLIVGLVLLLKRGKQKEVSVKQIDEELEEFKKQFKF
ncbi:hypothetical protein DRJ25_02170, partial [Candidatus Woesearchaeota archaeon]